MLPLDPPALLALTLGTLLATILRRLARKLRVRLRLEIEAGDSPTPREPHEL